MITHTFNCSTKSAMLPDGEYEASITAIVEGNDSFEVVLTVPKAQWPKKSTELSRQDSAKSAEGSSATRSK